MKKTISLFMAIMFCAAFCATAVSCAGNKTETTTISATETTKQTQSETASSSDVTINTTSTTNTTGTTSTTAPVTPPETTDDYDYGDEIEGYCRSFQDQIVSTPSRIMFYDFKLNCTCYYSKADGKAYVFCFDPLCSHGYNSGCTAKSMLIEGGFCYCKYDGRLYYAGNTFTGKVYSTAFDGTDKKLIFELEDFSQEAANEYNVSGSIYTYGKYVYISCYDSGKMYYYVYNVSTGKIFRSPDTVGERIIIHYFYKGKIYFGYTEGCYKSDPDFTNIEKDEGFLIPFSPSCIYKNIMCGLRSTKENEITRYDICAYNIDTGKYIEFSDEVRQTVAFVIGTYNGDMICVSRESYFIGKNTKGHDIYSYKLYRVSLTDGSISLFSDDLYHTFVSRNGGCMWFDGNKMFLIGTIRSKDEDGFIVSDEVTLTGTVGKDGKLTGIKELTIY